MTFGRLIVGMSFGEACDVSFQHIFLLDEVLTPSIVVDIAKYRKEALSMVRA